MYVDLTDCRMFFEMTGKGQPLVLIPGLGSTALVWQSVVEPLSKHFTLIQIDNRGVGRSKARRPARTLRDYSTDLVELLDYLQVDQTHVLGLSLGGVIAQRLATDHASRVKRLILASCAHRFGPYLREMALLLGTTARGFPPHLFARMMELLGSGPAYLDANPDRLESAAKRAAEAGVNRTDIINQLQCLSASDKLPVHIQCPTFVIAGEHDSLIPPYYAKRMAAQIADNRLLLINEAGHNPFIECPQIVVPHIVTFLEGREPVGSRRISAEPALNAA